MSVLIEGINLVIQREAANARYPGGVVALSEAVSDAALCMDDHLIRFGFLEGERVDAVVEQLESAGLELTDGHRFLDFAIVDQMNGLPLPCDWLEFDSAPGEPAFCWKRGEARGTLVVPSNWRYEHSLSRRFGRITEPPPPDRYRLIDSVDGIEVYEEIESGKTVYFARTDAPPGSDGTS